MKKEPVILQQDFYSSYVSTYLKGDINKDRFGKNIGNNMRIEAYSRLTEQIEYALDKADYMAERNSARLSHDEVFGKLRAEINGK